MVSNKTFKHSYNKMLNRIQLDLHHCSYVGSGLVWLSKLLVFIIKDYLNLEILNSHFHGYLS
jgi:hypothetical protein